MESNQGEEVKDKYCIMRIDVGNSITASKAIAFSL